MAQRLLTVKQAADEMGLSARTIWAWVYQRKIGVVRLGRAVRVPQQRGRGTSPHVDGI